MHIKDRMVRMRIPSDLYDKYKILCIEMKISCPKQMVAMIKSFIRIQEESQKLKE